MTPTIFLQISLSLPLQLAWEHGLDLPFAMGDYLQSVVIEGKVFVGGGYGGYGNDSEYIVMEYDGQSGEWAKLPRYRACNSALVAIENHLVLVSGYERSFRIKALGVWDSSAKQWVHPYPEMKVGRSSPSAVVYSDWLVVSGGRGDTEGRLSSVEALNIPLKQWHIASPMPVVWARMKSAVVGNTSYFMGGGIGGASHTQDVYSVYLPALIMQLNSKCKTDGDIWKKESTLTTTLSSPLSMHGCLFAFGGWDKDRMPSTSVLLYRADSREWVKAGDMPRPRYNFTCAVIKEGEILVAGGDDAEDKYLQTVDKAVVK